MGIDFGPIHNALIWLAENPEPDRNGRLSYYAYRESMRGNRTTAQHVFAALREADADNVAGWYGGSASEKQERWDWRDAGIRVQGPRIRSVEAGIDRVIGLFKQKRLFVFRTMKGLRDELGTYTREVDAAGDPTEKIKNRGDFHRLDALRSVVIALTRVRRKAKSWQG